MLHSIQSILSAKLFNCLSNTRIITDIYDIIYCIVKCIFDTEFCKLVLDLYHMNLHHLYVIDIIEYLNNP